MLAKLMRRSKNLSTFNRTLIGFCLLPDNAYGHADARRRDIRGPIIHTETSRVPSDKTGKAFRLVAVRQGTNPQVSEFGPHIQPLESYSEENQGNKVVDNEQSGNSRGDRSLEPR